MEVESREQLLQKAHEKINWLNDEYDLFYFFWHSGWHDDVIYFNRFKKRYIQIDDLELFELLSHNRKRILNFARLLVDFNYLREKKGNSEFDYFDTFEKYEQKTFKLALQGNFKEVDFVNYVIEDIRSNDTQNLYIAEYPDKVTSAFFSPARVKEMCNLLVYGHNKYVAEFVYNLYIKIEGIDPNSMPSFEEHFEQSREGSYRPFSIGTIDFTADNIITNLFLQSPATKEKFGYVIEFINDESSFKRLLRLHTFDKSDEYRLSSLFARYDSTHIVGIISETANSLNAYRNKSTETFQEKIKRTGSFRDASAEERLETDCSLARRKNFEKRSLNIFGAGIVDLTRLEKKFSMYNEDL